MQGPQGPKGGEWGDGVESLKMGPCSEPLDNCNEVWVTTVIFFNGVVPWQITTFCFKNLAATSQILIKIAVLGYLTGKVTSLNKNFLCLIVLVLWGDLN